MLEELLGKAKSLIGKKSGKPGIEQGKKRPLPNKMLLDLTATDKGMSCQEFTTLVLSGIPKKEMPASVRKRMIEHEETCFYHQSEAFHQMAVKTPVNNDIEKDAMAIIEKYRKIDSVKG